MATQRAAAKKPKKVKEQPSNYSIRIDEELRTTKLSILQQEYSDKIISNEITVCHGPAGTSKTFTACYTALKLFSLNVIKKIILVKPIQESGEKLGFLPGGIEDKIDPYVESYRSNFKKMINHALLIQLESEKIIEYKPLAYMRGATFDRSIIILDEAQNADFRQLMLFITRMGFNSKALLTGDVSQYDIAKNLVSLPKFIDLLNGIKGFDSHIFSNNAIVRNKILIEITERYEKWKIDNK